jgi:hypothetical protein
MALGPDPDPIELEVERVFAENPGLLDELRAWDRRFRDGEVSDDEYISTDEVRRRLRLRSVPLERDDAPEPHGPASDG